jgi:GrpB-like predicted nucleotidyltransferase (UPF0157 family)
MDYVHFVEPSAIETLAAAAFERHKARLQGLLPDADIQHIGSTAIPGALTKGDLDIQVRVEQEQFAAAETLLAQVYERNTGSIRNQSFASFKDDNADPPLGIQLSVKGGELDDFYIFRDYLIAHPRYIREFNDLKRSAQGLAMDEYRERKGRFVEKILKLAHAEAEQPGG